ncbi:MAG: SpoVR family protein [Natronospirillum sp.]|uniref:SpoVR family protein n=1 Tax=Natronospirillum sp. TaxID=2812955 RepID=UPI0025CD3D67|nr:SpoVR family protein [Natronospirillum sp.]MCH8551106.1 SpoVR family protein [Natronospirillum sp.]
MTAARAQEPISRGPDWSFDLIREYDRQIAKIAADFGLDTYPNQIEVISSEQMMDAYSSVGMPLGYHHWSYGKQFLQTQQGYRRGQMGLAYEIVINSDPCIAYLMEENTITMQALVIAHACYGHNSFFKNNYLFRSWTDASAIIDYLVFAREYVSRCEQKYGVEAVEQVLDSCHAIQNYGVDRYKRPSPISAAEEADRQAEREEYLQQQLNLLWRTIPVSEEKQQTRSRRRFPQEPQENLLYFIEKHAPIMPTWQREIVRIVRKMAQYFYPQRQTQVMNEGWATFWHYTIMNELYDRGLVTDGFMMEFLDNHAKVVFQPPFDASYYSGINPYALGFAMFRDLRRICEEPDDEDREWFPDIAGSDWLETLHFAMQNFKDESFIQQYLSPKVIRDFHFFAIFDREESPEYEVAAIHDAKGYQRIRQILGNQYNLASREPNLQIVEVDVEGDRSITLHHIRDNNKPLSQDTDEVMKHLHRLWGFDVHLYSFDAEKAIKEYHCTEEGLTFGEEDEEQKKYL